MEVFELKDLKRYNIHGLRAICSLNRDILSNFHLKSRKELEKKFINTLNNNCIIHIPGCIINNNDYFLNNAKKK
jgi:hypothetical protein